MDIFKIICIFAGIVLLNGCFFSRGEAVNAVRYNPDLKLSTAAAVSTEYQCGYVVNSSGAGRDLLFRDGNGQVRSDREKRWLVMPEQMLKNIMQMNLQGAGEKAEKVNADLLKFEFSASGERLDVVILLYTGRRKQMFTGSAGVKNGDFSAAAVAVFTAALNKFVQKQ